jgi:serine/threonine-protein kinase
MAKGSGAAWVGRDVGSYHLVRELGTGGMGVVFEGRHRLLERRVAVKTIKPDMATDLTFSRRFLLEARAIAALDHPGIIRLFDFAFEGTMPYMVMEYFTGESLSQLIEGGRRLEPSMLIELLRPVAGALDHAHENGVIHRDVKPANIVLGEDGRTRIMDFGLAIVPGFRMATDPGSFLGTPDYIAPEQVAGRELDGRADVYALAAVIYEAVTGSKPFSGSNWVEVASQRLYSDPPAACLAAPDLPARFSEALALGLARDREHRPRTATQLLDTLTVALAEPAKVPGALPLSGAMLRGLVASTIGMGVLFGAFVGLVVWAGGPGFAPTMAVTRALLGR